MSLLRHTIYLHKSCLHNSPSCLVKRCNSYARCFVLGSHESPQGIAGQLTYCKAEAINAAHQCSGWHFVPCKQCAAIGTSAQDCFCRLPLTCVNYVNLEG
eukprot:3067966-Amphidinium_carterae.1